jgi:hypothetical protein
MEVSRTAQDFPAAVNVPDDEASLPVRLKERGIGDDIMPVNLIDASPEVGLQGRVKASLMEPTADPLGQGPQLRRRGRPTVPRTTRLEDGRQAFL